MLYEEITGDGGMRNLDFVEIALSGEELLKMIREWREKLGDKSGILNDYLAGILTAATETASTFDTGDDGFDRALSELRGILRHIKEGNEEEAREHPFYPNVRAYMDSHAFSQDSLYYETYCVGLFPEYFKYAVKGFLDRCNDKFRERLNEYGVPRLYETLLSSGAGITADDLKYLSNLFSRVLSWTAPSTVFMQGMIERLTLSLISQDKKSGKYVFEMLLDGTVAYE